MWIYLHTQLCEGCFTNPQVHLGNAALHVLAEAVCVGENVHELRLFPLHHFILAFSPHCIVLFSRTLDWNGLFPHMFTDFSKDSDLSVGNSLWPAFKIPPEKLQGYFCQGPGNCKCGSTFTWIFSFYFPTTETCDFRPQLTEYVVFLGEVPLFFKAPRSLSSIRDASVPPVMRWRF